MYPTKMEANGHIYKINTDYRIALACFKAVNDEKISNIERFYAIETLLLGYDVLPQDEPILQKKIADYLRCGNEDNINENEIDMDYIQDESTIRTSIRQCYHIDLNRLDYLHWWEYNELISGLTNESLLNKIRDLRNYDVNEITDIKRRDEIQKAKKHVSLEKTRRKLTKEEKQSAEKFYELSRIRKR